MKILLDTCVWGGTRHDVEAAGHLVSCGKAFPLRLPVSPGSSAPAWDSGGLPALFAFDIHA